jgi:predicted transcriptional regulator
VGKELFYVFFRDKPANVLLALLGDPKGNYASSISKEVDCTYPHIVKILAEFKAAGLIEVSSKGRLKPISLTPKGKKIALKLNETKALVSNE